MSNTLDSFRNRKVYVSSAVFDGLQAMAELEGLDSPDAWADLELGRLLSQKANLSWLLRRRKEDREKLKQDYADRLRTAPDQP